MRPLQSYLMDPLRLPAPFLLLCLTLVIASLLSLLALLFLFLWVALSRAPSTTRKSSLGRSAAVVVLGDVGRSPRMCYHVQSLAEDGWRVAVLGYPGMYLPKTTAKCSADQIEGVFLRRNASAAAAPEVFGPAPSPHPTAGWNSL